MSKYIFFVGKPYPHLESLAVAHDKNYKIGIFLDKTVSLKNKAMYSEVIELDFSTPESILAGVADINLQVDGLVCTYENYIIAKSYLANHFDVAAPSTEAATISTDKNLMRQAFMRTDPSITPNFGLVSSEIEALELAKQLKYPLILKPTNLVKSLLVLRCQNEEELLVNFDYAQKTIASLYTKYKIYGRVPQLILEEYITGKTCSVAAFVDKYGKPHICDGIVELTNANDVGVDDSFLYSRKLPADFDENLTAKILETAKKGIKAMKLTSTAAHVELIYNKNNVKLIEIGARIGGYRPRMYDLSYGVDLVAQEIQLALGQIPDLSGEFMAYTAVYELFPKKEGRFAEITEMQDTSMFNYFSIKATIGQQVGPSKMGYKAAAVIIISHPDKNKFNSICSLVDAMKVKIN